MLIFRLLPLDTASAFGGWLGRTIGPRLGASRKALKNIEAALPDADKDAILLAMWNNLGRVVAEYPHLQTIGEERVEIVGADILQKIHNEGQTAMLFSGHLANWEVTGSAFLEQLGIVTAPVYRAPNNPWADKLLLKARTANGKIPSFPKSKSGTRALVQAMKNGQIVGILIDQKYNEGIAFPFFDTPAMTSPAFIQLPQKFKCPLVPVQVERLEGAHFRVTFYKPLFLFDDKGETLPVEKVMETAHNHLENWIRQNPGQWLWLHRRWSDKAIKEYKKVA